MVTKRGAGVVVVLLLWKATASWEVLVGAAVEGGGVEDDMLFWWMEATPRGLLTVNNGKCRRWDNTEAEKALLLPTHNHNDTCTIQPTMHGKNLLLSDTILILSTVRGSC